MPLPDGPIYVRGAITVRLPDGSTESVTRAALCACGRSARKPFGVLTHLVPES
ncbi:CDGSH iron-sulfur domain-containing protein [Leifsonia sp. EB41]|uniref:CDGSH iron-sulfur domain-containing protein n=1 Tax=Leifsonia sp. EB41 TaxID=3156260 RepID=UPI003516F299